MASRFKYAAASIDRNQYRGRKVPAKIKDVIEKVKENGAMPIPTLVITWEPPDKTFEIQAYEGGPDGIPSGSDLGRLIQAFSKMGSEDLGGNDNFTPIIGKYVWLHVLPMKTTRGIEYKRLPDGWLSDDEVKEHFEIEPPLAFLNGHERMLGQKLKGKNIRDLQAHSLRIPQLADHLKEVSTAIDKGEFLSWIETHTDLENIDGILTTRSKDEDDNGTDIS